MVEWDPDRRPLARAAIRGLRALPAWELVVLRPSAISGRPYVPRDLRGRVLVQTRLDEPGRAEALRGAAGFVAGVGTGRRLRLEALASGVAAHRTAGAARAARARRPRRCSVSPPTPSTGAARPRLPGRGAKTQSLARLGDELDALYRSLAAAGALRARDPLAGPRPGSSPTFTCTPSTRTTARSPLPTSLEHAAAIGLGAIAITDHNAFGGALEAAELARGSALRVIPGEEVKTDGQGEVIGLFIGEAIPSGMSFGDTVRRSATRVASSISHTRSTGCTRFRTRDAPPPPRGDRRAGDFNARLLFDAFNDEAARFARKYNLLAGAGSDAHVLQGVGTGLVRMRAFDTPEEFLLSLRSAEIVRRPKSLLYLQGLKWAAELRGRRRESLAR